MKNRERVHTVQVKYLQVCRQVCQFVDDFDMKMVGLVWSIHWLIMECNPGSVFGRSLKSEKIHCKKRVSCP